MLQSVFDTTVFATTFTTLLVIQDPLGAIPIFLSLTSRQTPPERAASARQATVVSFAVIVLFAAFGRYILKFLGISVPSLQVAGGLLLLLVALELLTDKVDESPDPDAVTANAALVPLGTPLLAGPGAIVAAMVEISISRCLTWPNSCAKTARSSPSSRISMIPVVTATAACCGERPVAKALGIGVST